MTDISLHTSNLYKQLREDIVRSSTVYIMTSFIMKSGVEVIFNALQDALNAGADVKILTGDYLYITQPQALERLLDLEGDSLEIRLWKSGGVSFHPKTYIFKHKDEGAMIIGSSNLSRSALTTGIEWNLRMKRQVSLYTFNQAIELFIEAFYDSRTIEINRESIKTYQKDYDEFHYKHPKLIFTWTEREEIELTLPNTETFNERISDSTVITYPEKLKPRPAQLEALAALEETMEEEYDKAMVVMATGLGKTYLAAFFAKKFNKILFVAHREEILKQAKNSFERVIDKPGGLYYGIEKDPNHSMIFASIFTLSIQENLHQFDPKEFDLIIVDEFHHAAAKSYRKVIDYFEPKFLLGLTATPERTDGQDVFALCDGNVAYEITFIEAIQRNWLAPFVYYGVKDDIDYNQIKWLGNQYDQHELMIQQLQAERAEQIYKNWKTYKQTRTLAFTSSIQQAEFLCDYFKGQGVRAIALTSQTKNISRGEAIRQLEANEIDIIFTVDLFNEGVDIPSVDTILFARPTESLVVFTQQIGRGLRKFAGKDKCVIIDLIGNYRNADTKLRVFNTEKGDTKRSDHNVIPVVPASCKIHLETEVINLLEEMRKKRSPQKERIYLDYLKVKEHLGERPTYYNLHLHGTINSKEYRRVFGGYFAFLNEYGELTDREASVYKKHFRWLEKVEKEHMSKSYKMIVLQYLLDKGPDGWLEKITPEEIAPYFHQFFMEKEHRKRIDFSDKSSKALWNYNEAKVARLIANMPMSKWVGKDGLITFENNLFGVNFEVEMTDREILHQMTQEICEYKMKYYFERRMDKT